MSLRIYIETNIIPQRAVLRSLCDRVGRVGAALLLRLRSATDHWERRRSGLIALFVAPGAAAWMIHFGALNGWAPNVPAIFADGRHHLLVAAAAMPGTGFFLFGRRTMRNAVLAGLMTGLGVAPVAAGNPPAMGWLTLAPLSSWLAVISAHAGDIATLAALLALSVFLGALLGKGISARSVRDADRQRHFADATVEGLLFWRDGIIIDVNEPLCRILRQPAGRVIGRELSSVFTPASWAKLTAWTDRTVELPIDAELALDDGETRASELVVRCSVPALGKAPWGLSGVMSLRDVAARKAAEARIQHLAHYDPTTGLANRYLFRDRLRQALSMAERTDRGVALFYIDLDRFKAVNDLFGHQTGDKVLQEAANRLTVCVRDTDTVARLGGDEFSIIQVLSGEITPAAVLAQRVLERLGDPYFIDDHEISVGASIGVALYPHHGSSGETLLRNADLAMYRAKSGGRDMFCFFAEEMDREVRERQALENDLRDAILNGELELSFQPLFNGETLEINGYEALVRWRHPVRGAIATGEFISLAEDCGLIVQLGRWVLENACREASGWDKPYYVAVNLSPRQFRQPDLAQMIMTILRTTGLPASRLELEVTEGVLIEDDVRALELLTFLRAQGIRLALDDFGTGYSSLSYLRRFPFDRIKIDRSFVMLLGQDRGAEAIVRAIVALGNSLGMEITAEGVETEAQLAQLRLVRCEQIQGYLLGRPIPQHAMHLVPS